MNSFDQPHSHKQTRSSDNKKFIEMCVLTQQTHVHTKNHEFNDETVEFGNNVMKKVYNN